MTTRTAPLPRSLDATPAAGGWLARLGRALRAAHREAFVSRHELDARLLADINAPAVPPTPDELRDAYRRWFGGEATRNL
jgi:hypothetical protein